MKFVVFVLAVVSTFLISLAEENPVGAGDSLKETVFDATSTIAPNGTAVLNPDPVNSEQKISNLSASKEKPEESVGDKIAGAAGDAKDSVVGAAKSAGETVSDAAGNAANKVSAEVNSASSFGQTAFSIVSSLALLTIARFTSF